MKKYTSRFLKTLAICLITFPLVYPLTFAVFFNMPIGNFGHVFFSPFFYFICAAAVVTGYGFWEVRRWAWYTFLFTWGAVGYYTASIDFKFGASSHAIVALLIYYFLMTVIMIRIRSEIRVPFLYPRVRWWERTTKYHVCVPVRVVHADKGVVDGQILDLSLKGCFIKSPHEFALDEAVSINFGVFGQVIECEGNIVWKTHSTVTLPRGIGIRFRKLSKLQNRRLRIATRRLLNIINMQKLPLRVQNKEAFLRNIEEIQFGLPEDPRRTDG